MSDDASTDGTEHRLEKQMWASAIKILELADDGGIEASHTENRGPVKSEDTLECTCGREFDDRDLAVEHLRSVRAVKEQ